MYCARASSCNSGAPEMLPRPCWNVQLCRISVQRAPAAGLGKLINPCRCHVIVCSTCCMHPVLSAGLLWLADSDAECRWVNDKSPATLVQGFDQEAAAVLTARLASWKMESEEDFDATRWASDACIASACRASRSPGWSCIPASQSAWRPEQDLAGKDFEGFREEMLLMECNACLLRLCCCLLLRLLHDACMT